MNLELTIQDTQTGKAWDVSWLLTSVSFDAAMQDQPGVLTFTLLRDKAFSPAEGNRVFLRSAGKDRFSGWIFKITQSEGPTLSVTAYDQVRYLKNTDAYIFSGLTASQVFEKICVDYQLKHKVVHPSGHVLPDRIFENHTLADMIDTGINLTFSDTGKRFLLRDNIGTLEFLDAEQLSTDLVLGEESLLTSFRYNTSIDESYNRVKITKQVGEDTIKVMSVAESAENIARWGLLQYHEPALEDANQAQLDERSDELLRQKNKVQKTLRMQCLGDWRAVPGNSVYVRLGPNYGGLEGYMLVERCTHTLEQEKHTMSLDLQYMEEAAAWTALLD